MLDDATKRVLYAQLWPSESTQAVMAALHAVITAEGLPMALYTDRAHWAFHTPQAKGPVDRTQLTQVGRALHRLGIEHVAAYSPQARSRSERLNRTLQDRLVNELRLAQIATVAQADPARAFVPLATVDLNQILCHEEERVVSADNTVLFDRRAFQLERQRGRRTSGTIRGTIRRRGENTFTPKPAPGKLPRTALPPR